MKWRWMCISCEGQTTFSTGKGQTLMVRPHLYSTVWSADHRKCTSHACAEFKAKANIGSFPGKQTYF